MSKRNSEIALNFFSESGIKKNIKWNDLFKNVCKLSAYFNRIGLKEKERVAAYVPNTIEAVVSFLASSKNGLVWSSCSPDFGTDGVIDLSLIHI